MRIPKHSINEKNNDAVICTPNVPLLSNSAQMGEEKKKILQSTKIIYDSFSENLIIENIADDSDLFQCGLVSLQVPSLLNALNAFLIKFRSGINLIAAKIIYMKFRQSISC